MMYGVMALYEVSLLYYQKTANSAGNRNLASVINDWNNSSKSFYELAKSYIFLYDQYDLLHELLILFKIKITNNCFSFIRG